MKAPRHSPRSGDLLMMIAMGLVALVVVVGGAAYLVARHVLREPGAHTPFRRIELAPLTPPRQELGEIIARAAGRSVPEPPGLSLNRRFNERHLVQAYQQHGFKDVRWDHDAESFLQHLVDYFEGGPEAPKRGDLLAAGLDLSDRKGCKDPAVFYGVGVLYQDDGQLFNAKRYLLRAAEGFMRSTYAKTRLRFTAVRLTRIYRDPDQFHGVLLEQWIDRAMSYTEQALRDGDYQDGEQELAYNHIFQDWNNCYGFRKDQLVAMLERIPQLDPWLYEGVRGGVEISLAWEARGNGWSSTVTPEGWRGFAEHLALAHRALTKAWALQPTRPGPAAAMITVAMGGGGGASDTVDVWFERAITACFDHLPAYRNLATARQPRWGGSLEAMYELARACAKTRRYDTDVPYQLFEIFRMMDGDAPPQQQVWNWPDSFELLKEMFEGYLAANEANRPGNATLYAACAWKCRRYAEAYDLLRHYQDVLSPALVERQFGLSLAQIQAESAGRGGPLREALAAAEALADHHPAAARQQLVDLLRDERADAWTVRYVNSRLVGLNIKAAWEAGDWIPVQPPPGLEGWVVRSGSWSVEEDGALMGTSGENGMMLMLDTPLDSRFELRVDVELVGSPHANKHNGGVMLVRAPKAKPGSLVSALVYRREAKAFLLDGFPKDLQEAGQRVDVVDRNHLRLQCRLGRCSMWVNEELVAENLAMKEIQSARQVSIGVGGCYWYNEARVRFRNLEIRKLPTPAEHPQTPPVEQDV